MSVIDLSQQHRDPLEFSVPIEASIQPLDAFNLNDPKEATLRRSIEEAAEENGLKLAKDELIVQLWFDGGEYLSADDMSHDPWLFSYEVKDENSGKFRWVDRKVEPPAYFDYVPVSVVKDLKEGDTFKWTRVVMDSTHRECKFHFIVTINQTRGHYSKYAPFEKAIRQFAKKAFEKTK